MKHGLWIALACAALAGCAAQTGDGGPATLPNVDVVPDTETQARARVFTDLAAGYFVRGEYKIVLEELRKAIQVEPRFGPAYNLYGLVYMELGEDGLAEDNFRRALSLAPADSEAHNNFGWYLCTRKRYDEGLAEFAVAIRNPLYDKPEVAMSNAAQCAEMKGDLDLADANYTKALKLTPENVNVLLRFAGLHYKQARYEDARRLLERLSRLSGASPDSLWLGLLIERKLGNAEQEAGYAEQLRRLFPDSEPARRLKAGTYE